MLLLSTQLKAALLAEVLVGISVEDEFADPFEPVEFYLEVDHPTLGINDWSILADEFDIGEVFVLPADMHDYFESAKTLIASEFDGLGFEEYMAVILDDDSEPFIPEWYAWQGGPAFLGWQITRIEAEITDVCRSCEVPFDMHAEWILSFYGDGVSGDYNGNGKVDAADYVVWRELRPTTVAEDYFVWRRNFGRTPAVVGAAVPEASPVILLAIAAVIVAFMWRAP